MATNPKLDTCLTEENAALAALGDDPAKGPVYIFKDGTEFGQVTSAAEAVIPADDVIDAYHIGDHGTDDVAATLMMIASKRINLLGVLTSFGNSSYENTFENAVRTVAVTGETDIPVLKGTYRSSTPGRENFGGAYAHGEDGLGGLEWPDDIDERARQVPTMDNGVETVVYEILDRWERRDEAGVKKLSLVSTGAMTDVSAILEAVVEREPKALEMIETISIMGGVVDKAFANIQGYTEFNFFLDPIAGKKAFDLIQEHNINTVVVPLDVTFTTHTGKVEADWVRANAQGDIASLAGHVTEHVGIFEVMASAMYGFCDIKVTAKKSGDEIDVYTDGVIDPVIIRGLNPEIIDVEVTRGEARRAQHDPNAVLALLHPEWYQGLRVQADMVADLAGEEDYRGRWDVKANDNSPITVVVKAEHPRVVAEMMELETSLVA